jgi:hypothetical protein
MLSIQVAMHSLFDGCEMGGWYCFGGRRKTEKENKSHIAVSKAIVQEVIAQWYQSIDPLELSMWVVAVGSESDDHPRLKRKT